MKYENTKSELEVIGNIFNNPSLLEDPSYFFSEKDFTNDFHRTLFGAMFNLYEMGVTKFQIKDIENYLDNKAKSKAVYESNNGSDFLIKLSKRVSLSSFEYYYSRLRKFSMLRSYSMYLGMDLSWIYDDDNILDVKKRESQDRELDNLSISDLDTLICNKIEEVRIQCLVEESEECVSANKNIRELIKGFKENPNIGLSLYGKIKNGIHAGARLGKFFLRSANGGIGKTRSMIADACTLGYEGYFEQDGTFVSTGAPQNVQYIIVEQDLEELQPMIVAFISGIPQDKLEEKQKYLTKEENERLEEAFNIIDRGKLSIVTLHEYNMIDLKETIRRGVFKREVVYFFFDYIETNIKILEEMQKKAGGKTGLREDQILFIITNTLKDLALQYNIFIESATQLNGNWGDEHMDSRMLAGGKAMDRKIDFGEIMLRVTPSDIEKLAPILNTGVMERPQIKIGVYKNRGKKYDDLIIWCKNNKGICRIDPLFVTDYNYNLLKIEEDYHVVAEEIEEESNKEEFLIEDKQQKILITMPAENELKTLNW